MKTSKFSILILSGLISSIIVAAAGCAGRQGPAGRGSGMNTGAEDVHGATSGGDEIPAGGAEWRGEAWIGTAENPVSRPSYGGTIDATGADSGDDYGSAEANDYTRSDIQSGAAEGEVEAGRSLPLIDTRPILPEDPGIRVGLVIGAGTVSMGFPNGGYLVGEGPERLVLPGTTFSIMPTEDGISMTVPGGIPRTAHSWALRHSPGGTIEVNGEAHTGEFTIEPYGGGVTIVESIPLETLIGGLPAGGRGPEERKAFAVLARTCLFTRIDANAAAGFDISSEEMGLAGGTEGMEAASSATRGEVLVIGPSLVHLEVGDLFGGSGGNSSAGSRDEDGAGDYISILTTERPGTRIRLAYP